MKKFFLTFLLLLTASVFLLSGCDPAISNKNGDNNSSSVKSGSMENLPIEVIKHGSIQSQVPFTTVESLSSADIPEYYEKFEPVDVYALYKPRIFLTLYSKTDLLAYSSTITSTLHQYNDYHYRGETCDCIEKIFGGYDDEYFKDNILIFYYAIESCCNFTNWVESVEIIDKNLFVNINILSPNIGLTAIGSYSYQIKISKADIKNTSNVVLKLSYAVPSPTQVSVKIKPEYYNKLIDESFMLSDFNFDNITDFRYDKFINEMKVLAISSDSPITEQKKAGVKALYFVDYVFNDYGIKPGNIFYARIKNEYISDFNERKFTINDFNLKWITNIEYCDPHITISPYLHLSLNEIGTTKANEAIEHLKTLDFVENAYY